MIGARTESIGSVGPQVNMEEWDAQSRGDPPSGEPSSALLERDPASRSSAVAPERPTLLPESAKWSWSLRALAESEVYLDARPPRRPSRVGDVVVVRVERLGYHASIVVPENRKIRIYPGDLVVGVLGNRYATDAYEAEVDGLEDLSLLTAAGMVGTVRSSHREMSRATSVSFRGSLVDAHGSPINLKERLFRPVANGGRAEVPLLVVVGTGMNSGKTTVLAQTVHSLSRAGRRVGAGKLTGSVSNRDVDEMRSAGAASVVDFSDLGFPSTYLASPEELSSLWREVLARSSRSAPDLLVMEIADGLLERETSLLLRDPEFRRRVSGVLLAADCPLSALGGAEELRKLGFPVLGVSGAFTSAPLFVREFSERSNLPVLRSTGAGEELAQRVLEWLPTPSLPDRRPVAPPGIFPAIGS